jgi:hypothetical protein
MPPFWYIPCSLGIPRGPRLAAGLADPIDKIRQEHPFMIPPAGIPRPRISAPVERLLVLGCCALFLGTLAARAEDLEAVSSKVSKDYVRKKLPDGTFQPETYAFGKGDNWGGARVDSTLDKMDFMDVARALAVPLAEKKYLPTQDPKTTRLLILVTWGTTRAPERADKSIGVQRTQDANQRQQIAQATLHDMLTGAHKPAEVRAAQSEANETSGELMTSLAAVSAENQRREDIDRRTAALLGYDSWWASTIQDSGGTGLGYRKQDMLNELEEDRYFVVLTAIDYQVLVKEKKSRMLWEARFSIRERGNQFDRRLAGMAEKASGYFGRDSGGLHHEDLPEGKVEIGPVKSLGVVPDK